MRAAKMMCAQRKKPIAMKKGGNPVAKGLSSAALKPKVVKPKKGKGSYSRKGKALSMSSGGKTKSRLKKPKGTKGFKGIQPLKNTPMRAKKYGSGGDVEPMKNGGKTKSRVNEAGNYTKPGMRKQLFNRIKAGGKGGSPGQWSARKAQMLASAYKKAGGGYKN